MSIRMININNYTQIFKVSLQNKLKYGEVNTDFKLVTKILQLIPKHKFKNPKLKWLDPCCGCGYFSMVLYKFLYENIPINNDDERHNHIINNMMYMIEINPEHIFHLRTMFGENANIINGNFLNTTNKYDMIYGNPPFNSEGKKKVPTNNRISKEKDGLTVWPKFIEKAIDCLKGGGYLTFITPSMWMKCDHSMFEFMIQYNIKKIHTLTNTETNTAFHGQAQTPTCYFTMVKMKTHKFPAHRPIPIYDKSIKKYIKCRTHINGKIVSLPLFAQSIIQRLLHLVEIYGNINVIKTSMRPDYKGLSIKKEKDTEHPYPNISTCVLNNLQPQLIINYSNKKCVYADKPKLVLAHKMHGFPYYDACGVYGISNRDNYIILNKTVNEFIKLQQFFSTKLALYIFEATRYRMKYLEKYIFELIPDITSIHNFPAIINDTTLADFFQFNIAERKAIQEHTKKTYGNFI